MTSSRYPMSRRQLLTLGGGIAAASLTLAACGTSGAGGNGSSSGGSGGGGTLEIWANSAIAGDADSGLQRSAQAFAEAHDVTINVQGIPTTDLVPKLTTTAGGEGGPDIAVVDVVSIPVLAAAAVLADITDKASDSTSAFSDELITSSSYEDKLYALPYSTNNVGLYYNKTMLDDAGIAVPTTWDELREAAIELTGGGQYGYMFGAQGQGAFLFWPWLWQNGGAILNDDNTEATFADDAGLEAFELYAGLAMTDKVVPPEFVGSNASWDQYVAPFVQETCAMMAIGPWGTAPITDGNPDLDWAVAPLPQQKEAASIIGGASLGVGANSANPDLALEFIQWATENDQMSYITDEGNIPARSDIIDSDWASEEPDREVFVQQMEISRARPAIPQWDDIEWGVMADMWDSVIQGQQQPADALKAAAESVTSKLSG